MEISQAQSGADLASMKEFISVILVFCLKSLMETDIERCSEGSDKSM